MKNSVKTVSNIFFIIFLSKLLGQAREMLIASSYGTGMEANAFLTATQIPLNFFDIILGAAIVSAFVPVFNEKLSLNGMNSANKFAGNFVGIVLVISVVLSVIGVICSGFLVSVMAKGFDNNTAILTSKLLKIMFPSMIFTAVAYSYAGVLQSLGEFKAPAAMSLVSNGITIIYLLLFKNKFGVYGLSVSMLIGWIMQLALLIPYLIKFNFKFGFSLDFLNEEMKKVYKLALPILLSSWVQPLNVMFNTFLASFLDNSSAVSAINYANKLYLIIASVFTVAITNLILPELSRLFSDKKEKESAVVIANSLKATTLFIVPVMTLFILFSKPIVEIVYKSGNFDERSVMLTSSALMFYSIGMIGFSWQEVLNKSFYSMQKSKIPMQTAFITIGANILLSLALFKPLGIKGLALSASLSATLSAVLLFRKLIKVNSYMPVKEILNVLFKSFISAVLMGVFAKFIYVLLSSFATNRLMHLLVICVVGILSVLLYMAILFLLKCKEIREIKQIFSRKETENE